MSKIKTIFKKYQLVFGILFLIAICFLFYHGTFNNGFVYDDKDQIINNPWIRNFKNIPKIFFSGVWSFYEFGNNVGGFYYRPFMHLIFSVEYHFFQLDSSKYHIINVCLHALNAVTVFIFLRLLLKTIFKDGRPGNKKTKPTTLAFFAAVIFAIYPINSEVVNWISAIPELVFTTFFLLAFYFYIKANENRRNYFFSLLFFSLGLLCKETMIMLPAILLSYDLIMGINEKDKFLKRIKMWFIANYPFFIIVLLYLILRETFLSMVIQNVNLNFAYIFFAFIWGVELFLKNIIEIISPFNLSIDHAYYANDVSLFYIMFTIVFLFFYFRSAILRIYKIIFKTNASRETRRLILLGFVLFAIPLLPALNYINLPNCVLDERYLYLPSVGFSLLASFFVLKIFDYAKKSPLKIFLLFALIAVLSGSFYFTVTQRNKQWKNDIDLFSDAAAKNSDSLLAQLNLAKAYCDSGNVSECDSHYKALCDFTANIKNDNYEDNYAKCLSLSGYNSDIGIAYFKNGDFDNAIKYYKLALNLNIYDSKIYTNLGLAYYAKHDFANAEKYFLQAANLSPNSFSIFKYLGMIYCGEGNLGKADSYFSKALKLSSPEEEISAERERCFKTSS